LTYAPDGTLLNTEHTYYELTDSAEPMLRLARERFPSLAAVPGDRETVDQTR